MSIRVLFVLALCAAAPTFLQAEEDDWRAPAARLADADAEVRLQAVQALGRLGPAAAPAVAALRDRLTAEEDATVRALAIVALGRVGPEARAALPELERLLRDASDDQSGWAATAMAHIDPEQSGGRVASALLIALTDPEPALRMEAATALGLLRKEGYPVVQALAEQWHIDDNARVRQNVKEAVSSMGTLALPGLLALLHHRQEPVRHFAADAIAELGPAAEVAAPELIRALVHDCSRHPFLNALRRIGPGAVPALVEALRGGDASVRGMVLGALRDIGPDSPEAEAGLLAAALEDPNGSIRERALAVVHERDDTGARALPVLSQALESEVAERRIAAAAAVGRWGPFARRCIPALQKLFGSSDVGARVAAASSLARIDAEVWLDRALSAMVGGLRNPAADTQCRAADALASLGSAAKPVVPELIPMLRDVHTAPHALRVLAAVGPDAAEALPALHDLRAEQERWNRLNVEEALRKVQGR